MQFHVLNMDFLKEIKHKKSLTLIKSEFVIVQFPKSMKKIKIITILA